VSIDFSHVGDPLDLRHVRVAFGPYQWHRVRSDIFGETVATLVPPLVALPRGRRPLVTMLLSGRSLDAGVRLARKTHVFLPDVSTGIERLLESYTASSLATFHREFYASLRAAPGSHGASAGLVETKVPSLAGAARYTGETENVPPIDLADMPPCVAAALRTPNDLLLKPEHIQHLTRWLLAGGWSARQIAELICSIYEADHGWGDRWTWMHPRTRSEFDVRVFAGMVATGLDRMVDFNCVSAQEKNLCPDVGCPHDLRVDRDRVLTRVRR
jgi:hypothetical protein